MFHITILFALFIAFFFIPHPRHRRSQALRLTALGMLVLVLAGCQSPATDLTTALPTQPLSSVPADTTEPTTPTQPAPTEPVPTEPAPTEPAPKELSITYNLVSGRVYKFGMLQERLDNTVLYLDGTIRQPYLNTTSNVADAADFYVERIGAGYYLYTYTGNIKYYLNVQSQANYLTIKFEQTASTVYFFKYGTLIVIIDGEEYLFGVRTQSTYTTIGLRKASESSYICRLYGEIIPGEVDWLVGSWEHLQRTDQIVDGFHFARLFTLGYIFYADGSGILGDYEWTNWDDGYGRPATEWTVPGRGFAVDYFSYALEGNTLYISFLGSDVEAYDPYLVVYTVTQEENGFISLKPSTENPRRYVNYSNINTLEELCLAFGVDYTLPKN